MKNILLFVASCILIVVLTPTVGFTRTYSLELVDRLTDKKELPEFCKYAGDRRWQRTETGRAYRQKFGPAWGHMHHFCWAMIDVQNARDGEAIDNLNYVIQRSSKEFPWLPMILLQKASILSINKKYAEAMEVYREIIDVKPDFEQAYLGMAELFVQQGDKKTTREIAKQGLIYLPESKKLKALLK